jgi:hypothetical protein
MLDCFRLSRSIPTGKRNDSRWKQGRLRSLFLAALVIASFSKAAADVITFTGTITQSTQDGTGPAINNPSLNNIVDGDTYTVTLLYNGSITSPGTYSNFAGAAFSDSLAGATEASFGTIGLTIVTNGLFDELSLLGCLTTGAGCVFGNQLGAVFQIPASRLTSQNVAARPLPLLTPMDLLEDDGVTDIHGTVTGYSYIPVPEPSFPLVPGVFLASLLICRHIVRSRRTDA